MHNYSNMRNKQMVINTCKILPFLKISRTHACRITPFSWFREFAPPLKKYPLLFSKMGTSVVYVLVGSGGRDIISPWFDITACVGGFCTPQWCSLTLRLMAGNTTMLLSFTGGQIGRQRYLWIESISLQRSIESVSLSKFVTCDLCNVWRVHLDVFSYLLFAGSLWRAMCSYIIE